MMFTWFLLQYNEEQSQALHEIKEFNWERNQIYAVSMYSDDSSS